MNTQYWNMNQQNVHGRSADSNVCEEKPLSVFSDFASENWTLDDLKNRANFLTCTSAICRRAPPKLIPSGEHEGQSAHFHGGGTRPRRCDDEAG